MSFLSMLLHRRSIRTFTSEPVSREEIEDLLVAGMAGPAGRGKKPWHFVVVQDPRTIAQLADSRAPRQKIFDTAQAVIAVFGDPSVSDTWVEDCSVAVTNMHLAADACGLGSCWVQGRMRVAADGRSTSDFVSDVLGVSDGLQLEAMLVLGHIDTHPEPHNRSQTTWEHVSWEQF